MTEITSSQGYKQINFTSTLYNYCVKTWLREDNHLKEVRRQTERMPEAHMQIPPLQGQLIAFLLKLIDARDVLEIGTYTGYSSLVIAQALPPDGKVITGDKNPEWTKRAQNYWQKAVVHEKIELKLGHALETLQSLLLEQKLFDFIFLDADKQNYTAYYEACLKLLNPGGLMAIDNVLWSGQVCDQDNQDPATLEIRKLNDHLYQNNRVDIALIPIGDGLTLVRKAP